MRIRVLNNFRDNFSKSEAKMRLYHYICSIRENLVGLFVSEDKDTKLTCIKNIDRLTWRIKCTSVKNFSGKLKRKEYYDLFMEGMDDEYSGFRLDFEYICDTLNISYLIYENISNNRINECRDIYYSLADAISVAEAQNAEYDEVDEIIKRLYEV